MGSALGLAYIYCSERPRPSVEDAVASPGCSGGEPEFNRLEPVPGAARSSINNRFLKPAASREAATQGLPAVPNRQGSRVPAGLMMRPSPTLGR